MRNFCLGLFICGAATSAHAASAGGEFDRSRLDGPVAGMDLSGVAADSRQDRFSAGTASMQPVAEPSVRTASRSAASGSSDFMREARARWREAYRDGHVSMARLVRVDFSQDDLRFSVRADSASVETGPFKVNFQPGRPSVLWSKSL